MKQITLIGCGRLGSLLAANIVYKSENYPFLKKLTLIDNDILDYNNLPYLFINGKDEQEDSIHLPKVYCLSQQLNKIKPTSLEIESIYSRYQDYNINHIDNLVIDCRDKSEELNFAKLKLCFDGVYGRIIINPKQNNKNKSVSQYTMERNIYYTNYFCILMCEKFIFDDVVCLSSKRKEFVIDMTKVSIHEVSS